MLVTFKCDAYETFQYFESVALQLLRKMGHSGTIPGAFKAFEVPEALTHLEQALAKIEPQPATYDDNKYDKDEDSIDIRTRAIPLIALLKAAIASHCDVLWQPR